MTRKMRVYVVRLLPVLVDKALTITSYELSMVAFVWGGETTWHCNLQKAKERKNVQHRNGVRFDIYLVGIMTLSVPSVRQNLHG